MERWLDCQRNRIRTGKTGKTVTNRLSVLRGMYGEEPCSPPKRTNSERFGINWDNLGYGHWDISADTKRVARPKYFLQEIPTMSPNSLNAHYQTAPQCDREVYRFTSHVIHRPRISRGDIHSRAHVARLALSRSAAHPRPPEPHLDRWPGFCRLGAKPAQEIQKRPNEKGRRILHDLQSGSAHAQPHSAILPPAG